MIKLINGDCLEQLRTIDSDSVDSLITDPPAGISFMGKAWDHDKGGRDEWIKWMTEVMTEAKRVMKPGAHGLVWALPRTSHWTATALENAGFEIRDIVNHIFGTGFPKSLDISKAIDKLAGAERKVVGINQNVVRESKIEGGSDYGGFNKANPSITAPATSEAKQWQGWGTALKPACEHWILIRRPIEEKTVAENVLKHGTGGINIDGCRVETSDNLNGGAYSGNQRASKNGSIMKIVGEVGDYIQPTGRFPANLVLDEQAAEVLDEQSGVLKSGSFAAGVVQKATIAKSKGAEKQRIRLARDASQGGASRFFYVAKASKSDRGTDNTHPTVKNTMLMQYLIKLITPPNGVVLDPFMGSGSTGVAAKGLGHGFIGIEKEPEYFEISNMRLDKKIVEGA